MSTSTPVWWWDRCKLLMTLPLMTFLKPLPLVNGISASFQPSIHHHHQHSTPTHTIIPRSTHVTREIAASCLHLIDPLSAGAGSDPITVNLFLNISFFKQNRGSKFHHSMTRSVADNTIKPIPAYPRGSHFRRDSWEMRLQTYRKVSISLDPQLFFVSRLYCTASSC